MAEFAQATEEARVMLAQTNVHLDIDPEQGLVSSETMEEVRDRLLNTWLDTSRVVDSLSNVASKSLLQDRLQSVLKTLNSEDVLAAKDEIADLKSIMTQARACEADLTYRPN
jgi:hypothetical protein